MKLLFLIILFTGCAGLPDADPEFDQMKYNATKIQFNEIENRDKK